MLSDTDQLTEKEKQTLRLLASGYDAKSMAQHLGLSVHTVNERLREARRKMGVSSSRAAARKLRDAEGFAPAFLGPKSLGAAMTDAAMAIPASPAEPLQTGRPIGMVIGVTVMIMALAAVALGTLSGPAVAPTTPAALESTSAQPAETGAVRSARAWLALVDAGDWQRSWDGTTASFQSLNTRDRWAAVAASVQTPLGSPIGHELISEDFVPTPPSGYQLVKFRSRYTNKAETLITISLERNGDGWKVAGIMLD